MAYWRSLALVLRVLDYSETSQIAHLLTRERGRVSAIAKGARRRGSRFAGELEPIQLGEVVCFQGRDPHAMQTLSELEVRDTYRGVRQDLRRLRAAAYVVELLRESAPEGQPLPEVFDLAAAALARIAAAGDPSTPLGAGLDPATVPAFEARLLDLLGLFPRLEACVECGEAAGEATSTSTRPAFSARLGGILCAACRPRDRAAREASAGALATLATLGRSPEKAERLRIPASQHAEIRAILDAYLPVALDRELKLAKYIA